MARSLSHHHIHRHLRRLPSTTAALLCRRNHSTKPKPELDAEEEKAALRRLEEAVQRVIVRKAQPRWIPLVPGGSYWVPPTSAANGFARVVADLVKDSKAKEVGGSRLWNSSRGWPSSAQFFIGTSQSPSEGELSVKRPKKPEDEEG